MSELDDLLTVDERHDAQSMATHETRRTLSGERRNRRRDRWLIAGCTLMALGSATALGARIAGAAAPVPTVRETQVQAASGTSFSLLVGGDTMLSDGALPLMQSQGVDAPLMRLRPLLASADYTLVNAESPISDEYAANARPGAKYSYNSSPDVAAALARAGVDALALNNNHSLDRGPAGLSDTMAFADAAQLETVGAGVNTEEAERPLLVHTSHGTIGIVNLGENFGPLSRAGLDKPGMVPLGAASVQRGLDLARAAGADHVIAVVHWGDNYSDVNEQQRYWAQVLAEAGYDAVVGAGSHSPQPVEVVGQMPVFYGLGNFSFGAPGRFSDYGRPGVGLTARITVRAGQLDFQVGCLATDNEQGSVAYQSRPCTATESSAAFHTLLPAGYTMAGSEARIAVR